MITVDHVSLTYPDGASRVTAVDEVTLTARPGTLTLITGASGSGKSSLLALASCLTRPDSGTVVVDDQDTASMSREQVTALRRERIGIVFQAPNLLASLTAVDQLVVMGELGGPRRRDRARRRSRALELLDEVGLAGKADRLPAQLSGGERQRVNIARALMNDPSVLVVDEPTSALDSSAGARVVDLLVAVTARRSAATLLVTHDRTLVPRGHRHLEMVDGRLGEPALAG